MRSLRSLNNLLLFRLKDIFLAVQDVELIDIPDSQKCLTLKNVLEKANLPQADLSGYIALTDSILHLIMYNSNKETEEVSIMIVLFMCM